MFSPVFLWLGHNAARTDKKLRSFKSLKWISGQGGVDKVYQLEDGMIDKRGVLQWASYPS